MVKSRILDLFDGEDMALRIREQAEEASHDPPDLVAEVLLRRFEGNRGRVEGLEHVEGHASIGPRRVDDGVVGLLEGGDVLRPDPPLPEALLPQPRGVTSRGRNVLAVPASGLGIDPGLERRSVELLEEELKETPVVSGLVIFSIGILIGRFLR